MRRTAAPVRAVDGSPVTVPSQLAGACHPKLSSHSTADAFLHSPRSACVSLPAKLRQLLTSSPRPSGQIAKASGYTYR